MSRSLPNTCSRPLCGTLRCAAFAAILVASFGCENPPAPAPAGSTTSSAAPASAQKTVTILFTADENGALLPETDEGTTRGGAAELLGRWIADEHHCPKPAPSTASAPAPSAVPSPAGCAQPSTLALSGGDGMNGAPISTQLQGEPVAQAFARMGYAASTLGNHDLDGGAKQFLANQKASGVRYLAANLTVKDPAPKELALSAFEIVERLGVKIGVVGVASETTASTGMPGRFDGLEFGPEEAALADAIPKAWAAGADAVVALVHECPQKLEPMVTKHPEWKLSFVGGAHCASTYDRTVAGVPMASAGRRFGSYARVAITVDPSRPAKERVVKTEAKVVEIAHKTGEPAKAAADAELSSMIAAAKQKLDTALGVSIGYTKGIAKGSPEMARWVAGAWREQLGVDVAIVNKGGLREEVPKGPVTLATVYAAMPFENSLMILSLTGADLIAALKNPDALANGASGSGDAWKDASGKPIDPAKKYAVATIEYLYFGRGGFSFEKQDPNPKETGMDWRTPVVDWTRKQKSTEAAPLESKLPK